MSAASQPQDFVSYYRDAVAQTVRHNTDASAIISQLLCVDKPLTEKFVCLKFSDLLAKNAQSVDNLKRLIMGLNILEKYGRHLLKPPDVRSNMWRHIKFTNSIFRDRVDTIQGGREIMAQMGYSVIKEDGVAFPDDADPDHGAVLQLVVDILLAKKEIEAYLSGGHPHPEYMAAFLHPNLLGERVKKPDGAATPAAQTLEPATTGAVSDHVSSGSSETQTVYQTASEGKESSDTESEKNSSITCDICGKNHPDFVCTICDNKQLCRGCDITWHKHPKRQNHQRAPLGQRQLEQSPPQLCQGRPLSGSAESHSKEGAGVQAREPMSLYPSQPNIPSYANVGYSLPPTAMTAQTPVPNMMLGSRSSTPQEFMRQTGHQSMAGSNQSWTGSDMGASQPRVTGSSQYEPTGALIGMTGSIQSMAGTHPSSTSYQRGAPQSTSYVNIVNPVQRTQPSMHFPPTSPGMRPSMSYDTGIGYSMPQAPMQQYPGSFMPNSMQMFASHDQSQSRFNYFPTLPPQTLDKFQGAGQFTPQAQPRSVDNGYSPKTPEIPQTPSTGSGSARSSTASMSHLLPDIMAIPDVEKRMSRIRVDLMNLQEDIKEWDIRINAIILDNPNFFQDEDYKSLNRKKRRHLQEIKELESYLQELQKGVEEKEKSARQKESKQSEEEKEVERLRQRLSEIKAGEQFGPDMSQPQPQSQPQYPHYMYHQGMMPMAPGTPVSGMYMPYSMPQPGVPVSQVPVSSQPVYRPPSVQQQQQQQQQANTQASSDDLPDDIKKMLVLDQNPHEFKTSWQKEAQPVMNIPVTGLKDPTDVVYPPHIGTPPQLSNDVVRPKTKPSDPSLRLSSSAMKHGQSEPNLSTNSPAPSPDMRKNQSATELTVWECEHCTFQNEVTDKACAICYKTSENPKVIGPGGVLVSGEPTKGEPCEVCTYRNKPGTKICEMCARTQSRYVTQEPSSADTKSADDSSGVGSKEDWEVVTGPGSAGGDMATAAHTGVGKLIDQDQDKVYQEKKAAQEKFDRSQDGREADTLGTPVRTPGQMMISPAVRPGPKLPSATSPSAPNRDVERVRKKSDQDQSTASSPSSGSYGSAQTSLEHLPGHQPTEMRPVEPEGALNEPHGAVKKGRPQLDFAEAIEQISIKREQEQMSVDGHDFVQLIKEAENAGFEINEIEIAQRRSLQDKMKPLDWLRQNWQAMLDTVTAKAADIGKKADQNDVGDLSTEEAKEALTKCEGEVEKAARLCAQMRASKYEEISRQGPFAREDILTALFQNRGSIEEAMDQLNQAIVQAYYDRLWTEDRGGAGDAVLAAAARAPDASNSISNSIIGNDDFQRVVKDTEINRERRVRMVFVEGKLTSWGRADTVITILDQEVTLAAEPLQCTLEDVIEAVRNCGDRKSSLFYLTQECGCCFSLFPMSKINNLTACSCKICHDCIQQNFEVVIREKYVRNWNCPLCSLPDFEDETAASEYFEFLTLILQARVSQEVLELFETKLRDWHLQKDPNFRWCAHCASGFIWDRPDVLGMKCPHCRKQTCFMCKKKWEAQHEGLTCEQFTQWGIDNDPEKQAKGVQVYLEQNGIDCPSCKMRYDLAKGGCMHFKCPQCGHEFCSGCYQPFLQDGVCKMYRSCARRGLHCHHPRDCFYWLRDYTPADLQKLLKNHKVVFNTDPPQNQVDKQHCPVMEQKEYGIQKKDEPCNADTQKGMAGLCESHYKEYIVGLINKARIDPLPIMSLQQMEVLIGRNDREPLKLNQGEQENAYRKRVMQFIRENFKIPRK